MITACHMIIDDREKLPLTTIKRYHRKVEMRRLEIGDYRCACGLVGFERKEDDLSNMKQVLRQIEELELAFKHSYLIITRSPKNFVNENHGINVGLRIGFLSSCYIRSKVVVMDDHYLALELMYRIIDKHHDGKKRGSHEFNPVRHVKKKDLQLNVLTSLPGIGSERAEVILKHFGSIKKFLSADQSEMTTVPGLGKITAQKIIDLIGV